MMALARWLPKMCLNAGILFVLAGNGALAATSGDADAGQEIYEHRCLGCHDSEGMGLGPGAARLLPPPRDFTAGTYKIMSTAFDDFVPRDDDVFRMIRDGMPGTAMPGWADVLSEAEMWNLVAYVKRFAGYDAEEPGPQVNYGEQVVKSENSIARGRELFLEDDRCSECHGKAGKGNASKRLLGDNGERTWPRNLTKPWTFRGGSAARDIFTRISTGIPGTQMPSFDDPDSSKSLSTEDRWHVANYVASLATVHVISAENTVINASPVDTLPNSVDDPLWSETLATTFILVPQIISGERQFTPSNDTITGRAVYSTSQIAFLLEWDDRTRSIPGDETAEKIAAGLTRDGVAIQLPVHPIQGMEKPYFGMGDAQHPVDIWQWQSPSTQVGESTSEMIARGSDTLEHKPMTRVTATGTYTDGTWRVLFKRPLNAESGASISQATFTPIAFAAWDGSAGEAGSQHTMTTWYWLYLEPGFDPAPLIASVIVLLLVIFGQFWWVRRYAQT